jgi:hypothetical protein
MIQWITSITSAEMWLYGLVAGLVTMILGGWVVQRINHSLAVHRERQSKIVTAAAIFREAIDLEAIAGLAGDKLLNVLCMEPIIREGVKLEGIFFKHKRAIHEYRINLNRRDRLRLDKAWGKYHGGDEDCPTEHLFYHYCVPSDGPEKLRKRLEALKSLANKR